MFDQLRYNLKHNRKSVVRNATAWLIFGAIILVFVFWGLTPHNDGMTQGGTGAAAEVNNVIIPTRQYAEAMERMRRDPRFEQLQSLGGDAGRQILAQQAISQLVEMELIRQGTERQHIVTSDAEVRDIITSIPQFQEEGRFSSQLYRAYLSQVNKNPAEFEDEIRREQSLRRTVKIFSSSLKPIKLESEKQKALAAMKANVEFVSVPTETLVIPEAVPQADVKAFLAQGAPAEAKIKDYYEAHKAEFSTPERVKVRHILIRAKAGDAAAEKAALAKVEDLAKRAEKEDFAKLASQYSEDPGTKTKGGLLDFFPRGKMVPEFEDVAFTAPVNKVSKPVKTEYGYHLIQVLEKKAATNRSLDDLKEEIAGILVSKERSTAALAQLQELLKKGDEPAVRKFVTDHKLKWEETGPFSIETENVPKIGPNEGVAKLAFGLDEAKPLAPNLVREGARAFIVRYKAVPASAEPKKGSKPEPASAEKMNDKLDANSEMMQEMAAGRRAEDSLRKWIDELKKNSKITMNQELLRR